MISQQRSWRQIAVGLVLLPLSVLPFVAYLTYTPEGRLVRDRALVAVNPPVLPDVSDADVGRGVVPAYEGAVMVLAYHGLGSASDGEGGFVVSPERFGEHLVALRAAGMQTVSAAQVAAAFRGGTALPPKAVMITFDDGRADAMMFADPLLEQAGMKATMFVITGAADQPGLYYAGWDKLADATESGRWDLQAHTAAMHDMQAVGGRELPVMTSLRARESLAAFRTRIDRDLARANRKIAAKTGVKPVAFAYPFGAYGADRTNHRSIRDTVADVVGKRYALAFQQDDQKAMTLATPFDDRTALRRLEVGDWSGHELMQRIAGAADRSRAALAQRAGALEAQVQDGAPIPAGLVVQPTPSAPAAAGSDRRIASLRSATNAPPPAPVAPSDPAPGGPVAEPDPAPTTQPPRRPPTTEPAPEPEPTPTSAKPPPGKSGEERGNGRNKRD